MKKVVLLRHGESEWNRENRFTGWTDVALNENGVREALGAGIPAAARHFLLASSRLAVSTRK